MGIFERDKLPAAATVEQVREFSLCDARRLALTTM